MIEWDAFSYCCFCCCCFPWHIICDYLIWFYVQNHLILSLRTTKPNLSTLINSIDCWCGWYCYMSISVVDWKIGTSVFEFVFLDLHISNLYLHLSDLICNLLNMCLVVGVFAFIILYLHLCFCICICLIFICICQILSVTCLICVWWSGAGVGNTASNGSAGCQRGRRR